MTKEKKLEWLNDIYVPLLYKHKKDEDEYYTIESVWCDIGYVDCINNYDIEPTDHDINNFKKYMEILEKENK